MTRAAIAVMATATIPAVRRLLVLCALALGGACLALLAPPEAALGHAYLRDAQPADGAKVGGPLGSVRLQFTEAVEVRFSTVKVYPIEAHDDPIRLRAAAAGLVADVLRLRGDEAARADAGWPETARTSSVAVIPLKEELPAGAYVVMWRVLSIDTHITEGFLVFHYDPVETAAEES